MNAGVAKPIQLDLVYSETEVDVDQPLAAMRPPLSHFYRDNAPRIREAPMLRRNITEPRPRRSGQTAPRSRDRRFGATTYRRDRPASRDAMPQRDRFRFRF